MQKNNGSNNESFENYENKYKNFSTEIVKNILLKVQNNNNNINDRKNFNSFNINNDFNFNNKNYCNNNNNNNNNNSYNNNNKNKNNVLIENKTIMNETENFLFLGR
jgi:hypothetical protein